MPLWPLWKQQQQQHQRVMSRFRFQRKEAMRGQGVADHILSDSSQHPNTRQSSLSTSTSATLRENYFFRTVSWAWFFILFCCNPKKAVSLKKRIWVAKSDQFQAMIEALLLLG